MNNQGDNCWNRNQGLRSGLTGSIPCRHGNRLRRGNSTVRRKSCRRSPAPCRVVCGSDNHKPAARWLIPAPRPTLQKEPATVPGTAGLVDAILTSAHSHFAESRYETSDTLLKLIPIAVVQPAATWEQLGHLHFSLGEYVAAGRAYGFAAAYAPRDISLQMRLAHICLLLDDIENFKGYLKRALSMEPESTLPLQLAIDLNLAAKRYADAATAHRWVAQAESDHCK